MKIPKNKRIYCPRCGKHTQHKVSIYKKGRDRKMAQGNRRYRRVSRGYGSQPRPIQHNQVKVNKKITPQFECVDCGYVVQRKGKRMKTLEIVRK